MKALLTTLMSVLIVMLVGCNMDDSVGSVELDGSTFSEINQSSSSEIIQSSSSNEWDGDTTTNKPTGNGYPMYPTDTAMYGVAWGTSVDSFVGSCARTGYITPDEFVDAIDSIKLEVSVGWCYIDSSRTIYFANKNFGTIASISMYYSSMSIDYQVFSYGWYKRLGDLNTPQIFTKSDTNMVMSDTNIMMTVRNFYVDDTRFAGAITVTDPTNTLKRNYGSPLDKSPYSPEIAFYRMTYTYISGSGLENTLLSERWYMLYFSSKWVDYKKWLANL